MHVVQSETCHIIFKTYIRIFQLQFSHNEHVCVWDYVEFPVTLSLIRISFDSYSIQSSYAMCEVMHEGNIEIMSKLYKYPKQICGIIKQSFESC